MNSYRRLMAMMILTRSLITILFISASFAFTVTGCSNKLSSNDESSQKEEEKEPEPDTDDGEMVVDHSQSADSNGDVSLATFHLSNYDNSDTVTLTKAPHSGSISVNDQNLAEDSTTTVAQLKQGLTYDYTQSSGSQRDMFKISVESKTFIVRVNINRAAPSTGLDPVVDTVTFNRPANGKTFFQNEDIELTVKFEKAVYVKDSSNAFEGQSGFSGTLPSLALELGSSCSDNLMTLVRYKSGDCVNNVCGSGTPFLKFTLEVPRGCTNLDALEVEASNFFEANDMAIVSGSTDSAREWAPTSHNWDEDDYKVVGLIKPKANSSSTKSVTTSVEESDVDIDASDDFNVADQDYRTVMGSSHDLTYYLTGGTTSVADISIDGDTGQITGSADSAGTSAFKVEVKSALLGSLGAVKNYSLSVTEESPDTETTDPDNNLACRPDAFSVGTTKKVALKSYFSSGSSGFQFIDDSDYYKPKSVTTLGNSYNYRADFSISSSGELTVTPYFPTGDEPIALIVKDAESHEKVCDITVNTAPVLMEDEVIVDLHDTANTEFDLRRGNVLDNDADLNGRISSNLFKVTHIAKRSGSKSAVPDDITRFGASSGAAKVVGTYGNLYILSNGEYEYEQKSDFSVSASRNIFEDSFTYTAKDPNTQLSAEGLLKFVIRKEHINGFVAAQKPARVAADTAFKQTNSKVCSINPTSGQADCAKLVFHLGESRSDYLQFNVSHHFEAGTASRSLNYVLAPNPELKRYADFSISSSGMITVKPRSSTGGITSTCTSTGGSSNTTPKTKSIALVVEAKDGNYHRSPTKQTYCVTINTPPVANDDIISVTLNEGENSFGAKAGNVLTGETTTRADKTNAPMLSPKPIVAAVPPASEPKEGLDTDQDTDTAQVLKISYRGRQHNVTASTGISIQARWGVLVVDIKGDYTYTQKTNVNLGTDNWQDEFTYTLEDEAGAQDTGRLVFQASRAPRVRLAEGEDLDRNNNVDRNYYVNCEGGAGNNCSITSLTRLPKGRSGRRTLYIDPVRNTEVSNHRGDFIDPEGRSLSYEIDTVNFGATACSEKANNELTRPTTSTGQYECTAQGYVFEIRNNKLYINFIPSRSVQYGTVNIKVKASNSLEKSTETVTYVIEFKEKSQATNDIWYLSLAHLETAGNTPLQVGRSSSSTLLPFWNIWHDLWQLSGTNQNHFSVPVSQATQEGVIASPLLSSVLSNDNLNGATLCSPSTTPSCWVTHVKGLVVPGTGTIKTAGSADLVAKSDTTGKNWAKVTGTHGVLKMHHQGHFTYYRAVGSSSVPAALRTVKSDADITLDTFEYEIQDGKGSRSQAELQFKIEVPKKSSDYKQVHLFNIDREGLVRGTPNPIFLAPHFKNSALHQAASPVYKIMSLLSVSKYSSSSSQYTHCKRQDPPISGNEQKFYCYNTASDSADTGIEFRLDGLNSGRLTILRKGNAFDDSADAPYVSRDLKYKVKVAVQYCTGTTAAWDTDANGINRMLCSLNEYTSGYTEVEYEIRLNFQ